MTIIYDVHVESQLGKETDLKSVEVSVSFPTPSSYTGADGSGGRVKRAGTLSIKSEEFPGWYSAELISLTHKETGDQSLYEVTRHNNYPHVADGWVFFPVLKRG